MWWRGLRGRGEQGNFVLVGEKSAHTYNYTSIHTQEKKSLAEKPVFSGHCELLNPTQSDRRHMIFLLQSGPVTPASSTFSAPATKYAYIIISSFVDGVCASRELK